MESPVKLFVAALLFLSVPWSVRIARADCPVSIVSLSLASDEILVDIVDRKRISALTYFASDPSISNVAEKASGIPSVRANVEQVIRKSPDLVVLAGHTNPNIRAHLEKAGIATLVLDEVFSLESVKRNIRMLGAAVCERDAAQRLVETMERTIEDAGKKIPKEKPAPTVLFYGAPGFTVGLRTTINDIIESSGAANAAARRGLAGHANVSTEYVIASSPDIVLTSSYNPSHPDFVGGLLASSALDGKKIVVLQGKHLDAASHYAARAVEDLVDSLFGTQVNENGSDR